MSDFYSQLYDYFMSLDGVTKYTFRTESGNVNLPVAEDEIFTLAWEKHDRYSEHERAIGSAAYQYMVTHIIEQIKTGVKDNHTYFLNVFEDMEGCGQTEFVQGLMALNPPAHDIALMQRLFFHNNPIALNYLLEYSGTREQKLALFKEGQSYENERFFLAEIFKCNVEAIAPLVNDNELISLYLSHVEYSTHFIHHIPFATICNIMIRYSRDSDMVINTLYKDYISEPSNTHELFHEIPYPSQQLSINHAYLIKHHGFSLFSKDSNKDIKVYLNGFNNNLQSHLESLNLSHSSIEHKNSNTILTLTSNSLNKPDIQAIVFLLEHTLNLLQDKSDIMDFYEFFRNNRDFMQNAIQCYHLQKTLSEKDSSARRMKV